MTSETSGAKAGVQLAGYAGFGSFMQVRTNGPKILRLPNVNNLFIFITTLSLARHQEQSVASLVAATPAEYAAPALPPALPRARTGVPFGKPMRAQFMLGDEYHFVNHGAFGAVSKTACVQ